MSALFHKDRTPVWQLRRQKRLRAASDKHALDLPQGRIHAVARIGIREISSKRFWGPVRNDVMAQVATEHLCGRVKSQNVKLKVGKDQNHESGQPQLSRYLSRHQGPTGDK